MARPLRYVTANSSRTVQARFFFISELQMVTPSIIFCAAYKHIIDLGGLVTVSCKLKATEFPSLAFCNESEGLKMYGKPKWW